ncbi:MAG: RNA-directed DNA polymerase [Pirellulales bacterium]|nr:RNA-directed DNA polymerase [Pirellulales bacterium]
MTASRAKAFLLKPESYCNIEFPPYLQFDSLLDGTAKILGTKNLNSLSAKPHAHENVNYSILSNKDGRYAWRPLQLIHPALYVSLVEKITENSNWKTICTRFAEFQEYDNIKCHSIPVQSSSKRKDKATQILSWWQGTEQGSIELALDFAYVFHADITDCYAAIYTHSIAWALHDKNIAKDQRKDDALIGNIIDSHIQDMRYGQTNGIPQGSVLMDLVAEMVLGYIDQQLYLCLDKNGIKEYRILRYRDDYRIFVNDTRIGELILKTLTEVTIDVGLKLNTAKTTGSQSVVRGAIKADKMAWLQTRQGDRNLQKDLLVIHTHGTAFPNSGSLVVALSAFHERLNKSKAIQNPVVLISIAVDIAYGSPRTIPHCAAIVSKLLSMLGPNESTENIIGKIHGKLSHLPNMGHIEVWLQRISHPHGIRGIYREPICQLVEGAKVDLWNNDWISSNSLKKAIRPQEIVKRDVLDSLNPIVRPAEIRMFIREPS